LGSALVPRLVEQGREVVVLSRSQQLPAPLSQLSGVRLARWDARTPDAIVKEVDGAEAIVNLVGERAVGVRYTESRKQRIFGSRVHATQAIVQAIERAERRPGVFVSVSGVAFYGAHPPDEPVDESSPAGDSAEDFLCRVCVEWEKAARAAEAFGVRVVVARTAPVLGPGDGALSVMALPFQLFVGGPLGSGRQVFPWVHREDALAAFERCLADPTLSGPVNVVAPNAVTQNELAAALGRALHRPSWIPAPSFALKLIFGEGAYPMLTGQRVVPKRLEAAGFRFRHPQIDEALADALH
jgi:uncharacterized protein (TIGR01777 family)